MSSELLRFYRLAIPITMQILFLSARNITDILMTSSLGIVAVASVGIASKAIMVGMVAMGGLASGSSVLGAQYWGENNTSGLRKSIWLGLMTSAVMVLAPMLILFGLTPEWLISLASTDPALISNAASYLRVFGLAFVFLAISNCLGIALRVSGRASLATYCSLIGVALNIVISYVLIFGHLGLPALGILGAAWATVISSVIEVLIMLLIFSRKVKDLLPRLADLPTISKVELKSYLAISIPSTINGLLWALGIFTYSVIYGRIGTEALAVMASLTPLESIAASVEQGLATATGILLGNYLGQSEFRQAKENGFKYLKYSVCTSLGLGVLLILIMPIFLTMFKLTGDKAGIATAVYIIMVFTFWVKTINAVGISGVLRSGGDVGAGLKIDMIGQWGIGIPIALIGAFILKLSLPLVFALVMLEDICKAVLTTARIRKYIWIRKITQSAGV
ncbi:MATE family efflux transporter [Chitinibacter sp. GC72]|uniref:MATE family efflux transporter n=1 Tax=Chitinibacter sp. GC72 TaxID=1526917 RepID=UPI0012FA42DB|nr:MATE family efflux transporter [Chitinibacter sp. GC72]